MAEEGLKDIKNDKIFIAQSVFTDLVVLRRELEILREITLSSNENITEYIKSIVPTCNKAE